ncbi:MAG TPA: NAD-dependent dehydratase [Chitinophagaceae bacterium]|jgi:nucleoside-diphosphate-sugar epimerase|nr:NAD-dependent dehydratase [Chitinophagaceae bacterium]
MALHTILGANGTIATELIPVLRTAGEKVRLVSRNPKPVEGAEHIAADVLNREQVFQAVKGSDIVYLLVGLQYDIKIWRASWPVIMRNTIDACKSSGAKLIFFDNVYMYGKVDGPMTESTPFNPCSKKGRVRVEIAEMLLQEIKTGSLQVIIARAADFYGPRAKDSSVPGLLIFDRMKKGKTAQWFVSAKQPHSFTYTPDAARALYMLAVTESAYGQTWHLPTALPALTGNEFITIAAKYMRSKNKVQVLPKWLIRTTGLFVPIMKELGEMLYQNEFPYTFDSSKFEKAFPFRPTGYEEGIRQSAAWFLAS